MIKIRKRVSGELSLVDSLMESGTWINLTSPTDAEIADVCSHTGIDIDMLKAALDDEERSRIEVNGEHILVLINIPVNEGTSRRLIYDTIPLGIIITRENVVTVCLKDTPILQELDKAKAIEPVKRTRFLLQLLSKVASYYLSYLIQIDRKSNEIENQLHRSMRNEELIKLLDLSKSLVYFRTSLKSNELVFEKLLKSQWFLTEEGANVDTTHILRMYADDKDLLEDVIIENKQALEMSETYSNVLSGMMDAFASVISNNLNIVMKFLTSITIVMALPTMVASFFGMNLNLPFQNSPVAFLGVVALSMLLCVSAVVFLSRKNMF